MKKIKFFAMAALVAIGLSACQSGGEGKNDGVVEGKAAKFSVSFTMPGSRAADGDDVDAIAAESGLRNVGIWIFNANGSVPATGAFTLLEAADFTEAAGVYTQNAGTEIATTSGARRIYVGVNIPASIAMQWENEAKLLSIADAIPNLSTDFAAGNPPTGGFTLFSEATSATLQADVTNTVPVTVKRVVAKLVGSATNDPDDLKVVWSKDATPYLTMTYDVKFFYVFQEAKSSYAAPNYWTNGREKTHGNIVMYDEWLSPAPNRPFFAGVPTDAQLQAMGRTEAYYLGENAHQIAGQSLNSNTTYAMVTTQVVLSAEAVVNTGAIEYTTTTHAAGDDVFVVRDLANNWEYVTTSTAKATDVAVAIAEEATAGAFDETAFATALATYAKIYKYEAGYVHFQVYLGKRGVSDYAILRNMFLHLQVNGFNAYEGDFTGYPGTPGDPDYPIDPTDEEDPINPDPVIPTDPIDGSEADLKITITPLDWKYKSNAVMLE